LNNKGTIKFNVRDIFKSFSPSGSITNFGKSINVPAKRNTGGAESEQGRAH
jgi:hypothetical protein